MKSAPIRRMSVDLAGYPDLVVIYLGMRVNSARGIPMLLRTGRQIQAAVAEKPEGLLRHETMLFSLFPPHLGMRQYWRDFGSLEAWTRTLPHRKWWIDFLTKPSGTGFWHETYAARGGIEAIYDGLTKLPGLGGFAPAQPARGPMFSARKRLGLAGEVPESPAGGEA